MKLNPLVLGMLHSIATPIIASREPDQVIGRGDLAVPYMQRWMLLRKQATGPVENLYLHRFLRSDAEQPHDHPWAWATVILEGSYVEWTPEGENLREAGDVVFKSATDKHAITAVQPGTITAFATGPKVRDWGFHTEHGFVLEPLFDAYRRYVANGNDIAAQQCVSPPSKGPWADKPRAMVERLHRDPGTLVIGGGTTKVARDGGVLEAIERTK